MVSADSRNEIREGWTTLTHSHKLSLTHTHSLSLSLSRSLSRAHTPTPTNSLSLSHTHTLSLSRSHSPQLSAGRVEGVSRHAQRDPPGMDRPERPGVFPDTHTKTRPLNLAVARPTLEMDRPEGPGVFPNPSPAHLNTKP